MCSKIELLEKGWLGDIGGAAINVADNVWVGGAFRKENLVDPWGYKVRRWVVHLSVNGFLLNCKAGCDIVLIQTNFCASRIESCAFHPQV